MSSLLWFDTYIYRYITRASMKNIHDIVQEMHCRWKWGDLCPPSPPPLKITIASEEKREQWVGTGRREFVDIRF